VARSMPGEQYSAFEMSFHLSRYSLVKNYARDMNILHISRDGMHGPHFLTRICGAKKGVSIDQSLALNNKTIKRKKNKTNDSKSKIECIQGNAVEVVGRFKKNAFDTIVCFESLQYMGDPGKFITGLKKLWNGKGAFIISGPNGQGFEGGRASSNNHENALSWYKFRDLMDGYIAPADAENSLVPRNSLFYVGIWNGKNAVNADFSGNTVQFPADPNWQMPDFKTAPLSLRTGSLIWDRMIQNLKDGLVV